MSTSGKQVISHLLGNHSWPEPNPDRLGFERIPYWYGNLHKNMHCFLPRCKSISRAHRVAIVFHGFTALRAMDYKRYQARWRHVIARFWWRNQICASPTVTPEQRPWWWRWRRYITPANQRTDAGISLPTSQQWRVARHLLSKHQRRYKAAGSGFS